MIKVDYDYFSTSKINVVKNDGKIENIVITCSNCNTEFDLLKQFELEESEVAYVK